MIRSVSLFGAAAPIFFLLSVRFPYPIQHSYAMKSIQEGLDANDAMNKAVEHIKSTGAQMSTAIQKLIEANHAISTITRDLNEISLQTKILALNAGVEAAHVGAQGATFAVVADQIKEIAERCKKASESTAAIIRQSVITSESAIQAGKQIEDDIQDIVYQQYEISEVLNGFAAQNQQTGTAAVAAVDHEASAAVSTDATATPATNGSGKPKLAFDPATMATGHDAVDQQHRNLIDMVNQLEEAVEQGRGREGVDRLLNFLGDYAAKHFSMEEKIMTATHCPAAEKNREAHKAMFETYKKWRSNYDQHGFDPKLVIELKNILSEWLVQHICKIDCTLRQQNAVAS